MTKLLLSAAMGAALATMAVTGANAYSITTNVHSDITGVQLWLGQIDMMTHEAPGYFSNFEFSGTATDANYDGYVDSANIQLNGVIGLTINGLNARLTFGLANGGYVPGSGITFRGGGILVDVQTTEGWLNYSTIDAGTTNLGFLAGQPGHMVPYYGADQTTTGIVRDALPGLWDGVTGSPGFDRAAGAFYILGQPIGIFLEGTIYAERVLDPQEGEPSSILFGPPEVPVPGAIWLFGSSLLGLAGIRRLRG
jgi:hypothetical protein